MQILVACEYSGTVREAFRKKGYDAWSCDLLDSDIPSEYHIKGDVSKILHECKKLLVAHPPCTYMCNSGVTWLQRNEVRWDELQKANEFFHKLYNADIPRIAIENPIPHRYALLPKYSQIIQPYNFGHAEMKATCLWLKNLPLLQSTTDLYDEMKSLPKSQAQRIHYTSPGKDRWKIRSKTFDGIAEAMAAQWGSLTKELLVC